MIMVEYEGYWFTFSTRKSPKAGWSFSVTMLPRAEGRTTNKRWSGKAPTREEAEKRAFESAKE